MSWFAPPVSKGTKKWQRQKDSTKGMRLLYAGPDLTHLTHLAWIRPEQKRMGWHLTPSKFRNTYFFCLGPISKEEVQEHILKYAAVGSDSLKTQRYVQLAYQPASQHRFSLTLNQYQQSSGSSQLVVFFSDNSTSYQPQPVEQSDAKNWRSNREQNTSPAASSQ